MNMTLPHLRTVASITKSLSRMVEDLHRHAEGQIEKANKLEVKRERISAQIKGASNEAAKAIKSAQKIGALLED